MDPDRELEIEIKLQLGSFPNYLKLLGSLGAIDSEHRQINAYFDSPERLLSEEGWVLRVRLEQDSGTVTLKSSGSHSGLAVVRQEMNADINRGTALEVVNGYNDLLKLKLGPVEFVKQEFPGVKVGKLLQFENHRQKKQVRINDRPYVLEIDKTEFADGSVDYELEVELGDQAAIPFVEGHLTRMFSTLGIPFEKQELSKFQRALQRAGLAHT